MSTRIKICGITRPEDARTAERLGADAIGLVFAASPRHVDAKDAMAVAAAVSNRVQRVGLFMDPDRKAVEAVLDLVPLELLQFHGRESADFCRSFGLPYVKTVGAGGGNAVDIGAIIHEYRDAAWLLFDSHAHGEAGGTGKTADWKKIPKAAGKAVMLAGGLTPENVAAAIRIVQPSGVDVSSGVESRPGIKDPSKLETFINEVRRADAATA